MSEEVQEVDSTGADNASLWALVVLIPWMIAVGFALVDWYKEIELGKRALATMGIVTNIERENHCQYDYEYVVGGMTYKGGEIIPGNTSLGQARRCESPIFPTILKRARSRGLAKSVPDQYQSCCALSLASIVMSSCAGF